MDLTWEQEMYQDPSIFPDPSGSDIEAGTADPTQGYLHSLPHFDQGVDRIFAGYGEEDAEYEIEDLAPAQPLPSHTFDGHRTSNVPAPSGCHAAQKPFPTPVQGFQFRYDPNAAVLQTPPESQVSFSQGSSNRLDPEAPPFHPPTNTTWDPPIPTTPTSMSSGQIQQCMFSNSGMLGQGDYMAISTPMVLNNGVSPRMNPMAQPFEGFQRGGILIGYGPQPEAGPEARAMNVAGLLPGQVPSQNIPAWMNVEGPMTLVNVNTQNGSLPIPQKRHKGKSRRSRPPSTAGRSHGAASGSVGSFSCKTCFDKGKEMNFNKKSELTKHERIHQDKPFECEFPGCGHKERFEHHMARHRKTHTKERDFKCTMLGCDFFTKGFARKDQRDRHVRDQHSCPMEECEEIFLEKAQRQMHVRQRHPRFG